MTDRFKGHELYKMGDDWVFDVTECLGYKVGIIAGDKVESYVENFSIEFSEDTNSCRINYRDGCKVPFGIVRKACNILLTKKGGLYKNG